MLKRFAFSLLVLLLLPTSLWPQRPNSLYQSYIDKYAHMAVDQMGRYGIPASITLAQGLLESGAGRSVLATKANNHFGIKVGGGWTGPYVLRDDDLPNEKFRKYRSVAESYEDHSLFLKKPRYASLFTRDVRDYKAWARGLKACGYATSPTYAESLIRIIELYRLHEYDHTSKSGRALSAHGMVAKVMSHGDADFYALHPVQENNKNYYIRVLEGDNLALIAKETGVSVRKLRKYNELPKGVEPRPGNILYLKKKRSHADRGFKRHPHIIQPGQSMYDIAQMYGMKLKSLYKLNNLSPDYSPMVGEHLRIY